jgi:predicted glycosyltransferase
VLVFFPAKTGEAELHFFSTENGLYFESTKEEDIFLFSFLLLNKTEKKKKKKKKKERRERQRMEFVPCFSPLAGACCRVRSQGAGVARERSV